MTAIAARRVERVRLAGQRQQAIAISHYRLMLMMLLFIGVTTVVAGRLIFLAVFASKPTSFNGDLGLVPARADILDRNGVPMARTIEAWSIGIHPDKILGDKRLLAFQLNELMPEKTEDQYFAILNSRKKYAYLRRRAVPDLVHAVNALGEPAIEFMREPERLYPQASLAAHVLGYLDQDGIAQAGMEKVLDAQLSDPRTRAKPTELAVDARVQQALETELSNAMAQFSAIGAAGVVMDLKSSEVLAMASLPEVNPNVPGRGAPEARFNRATLGVYELGSTFKPFTVAMAMDLGIVTGFGQMYDCPKGLKVGRFTITDTHPFGRRCSVAEIMEQSSNIGTAQIAAEVGPQRQQEFLRRMHFLERVKIELKERGRTLTPGNNWGQIATMTVGYGHGIAVTPLHLATGYAALFNGGLWRPATLLKRSASNPLPKGERVFTEATSMRMRPLLRLVVTQGTGKNANAPGFRIGGKTGTAEKIVNGRYTHDAVVTSFAGVFPMDDPRYVIVAMLDEPKATKDTYGFHTSGWNVTPAAGKIVARIGPLLGVIPENGKDVNMSEVMQYVRPE